MMFKINPISKRRQGLTFTMMNKPQLSFSLKPNEKQKTDWLSPTNKMRIRSKSFQFLVDDLFIFGINQIDHFERFKKKFN